MVSSPLRQEVAFVGPYCLHVLIVDSSVEGHVRAEIRAVSLLTLDRADGCDIVVRDPPVAGDVTDQ